MLNRRTVAVFVTLLLLVTAFVPFIGAQDDMTDIYGRPLPEDAAPYDMQRTNRLCSSTNVQANFSAIVTVYQRLPMSDIFSDALVSLDNDFNLIPAAAESWEPSEDGLTWTFHLYPGLVWSDGSPFTAYDFEASYRYMATPTSAYDFTWMWNGVIANWDESVAGEVPPEEIGVRAVDDLTLTVTTKAPFPPLPNTLVFWPVMQAKALQEIGPNYILDPETSVSSGPYMLAEFQPGESLRVVANPTYKGWRQPIIQEMRCTFGGEQNAWLAFQQHQIEEIALESIDTATFEMVRNDPELIANYFPTPGDFRTDYLLFDTFNPPFDDVNVRMAFAKSIDRESIANNVIGSQLAYPAYSFLAPGFPASDTTGALRDIQAYDCDAAKQLLADAGYPNGEGFPTIELKLRGENDISRARYDAAAASISSCLNIPISVNNMEFSAYQSGLLERPTSIQFGAISYGMDYLDPANMLGLWVSTGRHSWRNADFDALVTEANSLVGDPERRTQLYQQAERILVEDVGGAMINHRIAGSLYQPYYKGPFREENSQGQKGWQWFNEGNWGRVYISADVVDYPTWRDSIPLGQ